MEQVVTVVRYPVVFGRVMLAPLVQMECTAMVAVAEEVEEDRVVAL